MDNDDDQQQQQHQQTEDKELMQIMKVLTLSSSASDDERDAEMKDEYAVTKELKTDNSNQPPPPPPRFVVLAADKLTTGSVLLMASGDNKIGRYKKCTILIPDTGVSRVHAQITYDRQLRRYLLTDMGSSNGTRLDGVKLSPMVPRPLHHGAHIQLGRSSCQLLAHIHQGDDRNTNCHVCLHSGPTAPPLSSSFNRQLPLLPPKTVKWSPASYTKMMMTVVNKKKQKQMQKQKQKKEKKRKHGGGPIIAAANSSNQQQRRETTHMTSSVNRIYSLSQ